MFARRDDERRKKWKADIEKSEKAIATGIGFPIIGAYIFTAIVLYVKRVHAEWGEFKKSKNRAKVLKNLLIYDRAGSNPPPLHELFS